MPLPCRVEVIRVSGFASHRPLLLASDVRAVCGILTGGRALFVYRLHLPARSYLLDWAADPNVERGILTAPLKPRDDEEVIEHLQLIGDSMAASLEWLQAWSGVAPGVVRALPFTAALVCCAVDVAAACRRELPETRHSASKQA